MANDKGRWRGRFGQVFGFEEMVTANVSARLIAEERVREIFRLSFGVVFF